MDPYDRLSYMHHSRSRHGFGMMIMGTIWVPFVIWGLFTDAVAVSALAIPVVVWTIILGYQAWKRHSGPPTL